MADADDTRPRGRSQSFLERAAIEAAAAMQNEYVDSQLVDDWYDEDGTLQAALLLHPGCRGEHATEAVSRATALPPAAALRGTACEHMYLARLRTCASSSQKRSCSSSTASTRRSL